MLIVTSRVLQNSRDALHHARPALLFLRQLAAAGGGESVVSGAPVVLGSAPFGLDPALLLDAVERRIKRALFHAQHFIGDVLDVTDNAEAMSFMQLSQRLKDQQVECSLECV